MDFSELYALLYMKVPFLTFFLFNKYLLNLFYSPRIMLSVKFKKVGKASGMSVVGENTFSL